MNAPTPHRPTPADRFAIAHSILAGVRAAGGDVVRCQQVGCKDRVHIRKAIIVMDWRVFFDLAPELVALLEAEQGPRN